MLPDLNIEYFKNKENKKNNISIPCKLRKFNIVVGNYNNNAQFLIEKFGYDSSGCTSKWTYARPPHNPYIFSNYYREKLLSIFKPNSKFENDNEFNQLLNIDKGYLERDNHSFSHVVQALCEVLYAISSIDNKKNIESLYLYHPDRLLPSDVCSRLMTFIVEHFKSKDIRVFIETNNDHLFNSLRANTLKGNVFDDEISFIYFDVNNDLHQPEIDSDGRLDDWPDGFFDEWDNNLNILLGF